MKRLTPAEFLRTVYLGDRACKAIRIESWSSTVVVEIDEISRVRSTSGTWDFYTDEDIRDGRLVFTGVESIAFEPSGPLPNDFVNELSAKPLEAGTNSDQHWVFEASVDSVGPDGRRTEVIVRITAKDVHLEDPSRPGAVLRD